ASGASANLEAERVVRLPDAKDRSRSECRSDLQGFPTAEVEGSFELRRIPRELVRLDPHREPARRRGSAHRLCKAPRCEDGGIDHVRDGTHTVERVAHFLLDLVQQALRSRRLGLREAPCKLQLDRDRYELLLDAVV